jgi:uncharacterized C2H2 Zn-finger protein
MGRGYISQRFRYVRQYFFPRWDLKKRWKVRYIPNAPFAGKCNEKNKEILVNRFIDEDDLDLLLIHEICHVRCPSHDSGWQNKFFQMSQRAKDIGRNELSALILRELNIVRESPPITSASIYRMIESCVCDMPSISYKNIVNHVAREHGYKASELKHKYKKTKQAFEKAK